jgi:tRNA-binding EMAP/Myf-like protein
LHVSACCAQGSGSSEGLPRPLCVLLAFCHLLSIQALSLSLCECVQVGVLTKTWHHPDSDKLFCEEIDVGEDAPRQANLLLSSLSCISTPSNAPERGGGGVEDDDMGFGIRMCGVLRIMGVEDDDMAFGIRVCVGSGRGGGQVASGLRAHFTVETFCPGRKVSCLNTKRS